MNEIKWIALAILVLLFTYTVFCLFKESFFKSSAAVFKFHWGRQFVADLYVGLILFHIFVYIIEGSFVKTLLWLVASFMTGNIACLIYLILNFDKILALMN